MQSSPAYLINTKIMAFSGLGGVAVNVLLAYLIVVRAPDIGFGAQSFRPFMPYGLGLVLIGYLFAAFDFNRKAQAQPDALMVKDYKAAALVTVLSAVLMVPIILYYINSTPLDYGPWSTP